MVRRTGSDPVQQAADELYGLPLDEFTQARNARAKQAKQDGDDALAAAVAKLPKPDTAAWLANQLARSHRDEVAALIELGASMREATATLDAAQLRQLSRQQHQVVRALVQQARGIARTSGRTVSDDAARGLEDTLRAALADEHAAQELSAARLVRGLSLSGFPGLDLASAPKQSTRRSAPRKSDRAAEREARVAAERARTALEQARTALESAAQAVTDTAADVERRTAELDAAKRAHTDAQRQQRQARADLQRAERAAHHVISKSR